MVRVRVRKGYSFLPQRGTSKRILFLNRTLTISSYPFYHTSYSEGVDPYYLFLPFLPYPFHPYLLHRKRCQGTGKKEQRGHPLLVPSLPSLPYFLLVRRRSRPCTPYSYSYPIHLTPTFLGSGVKAVKG